MRSRVGLVSGFGLILGGLFLLAFTQVTRVFIDPRRIEYGNYASDTVGDATYVILSALMLSTGLTLVFRSISPAKGFARLGALTGVAASSLVLLILHLTLFINSVTIGTETSLVTFFTASYLFHTGDLYSLIAVFLLFLLTLAFLGLFVACAAYLLMPSKFPRAIWHRRDWSKMEAHLVTSSLLLVFGLTLFLVYLVRIVVQLEIDPPAARSFFAQNLPLFYYLQIASVGLLILLVGARVFLINWGTQTPLSPGTVSDALDNVGRVERVFVAGALFFDALILAAPAAVDANLSADPVFLLNSRGLAWFFLLLAIPYIPYALSLRRLRDLVDRGRPIGANPFSPQSLRIVLSSLAGLALLSVIGGAANWSPLGLMIMLASWLAGVLLVSSVKFRLDMGLFAASFRNASSPPYFFGFLLLALSAGLMMWGAGNTYVATYNESQQSLIIDNASPYGADILFRVAGATVLSFAVLLPLALAKNAVGIKRSLLVPEVVSFVSMVVLGIIVFSVSVWHTGEATGTDAVAGFAFHQYYLEEKLMVAGLVFALSAALFWSFGRIVSALLRPRAYASVIAARQVR